MYSLVLMAALTTGTGVPDDGHGGGGGGHGFGLGGSGFGLGGFGSGWGGYGLGWGGYGSGWGGNGLGWGGYGSGWGGWGGYGLGLGNWGYGYGDYPLLGYSYSPMVSSSGWGWGTPYYSGGSFFNPGATRSLYYNPSWSIPPEANPAYEARLVVHVPPQARLTIDDYPTMSRSDTRVFNTPPLEPGKTYTYTLRGEMNRDGRFVRTTKTVEVKAGELSEVTLRFGNVSSEELGEPTPKETPSRR